MSSDEYEDLDDTFNASDGDESVGSDLEGEGEEDVNDSEKDEQEDNDENDDEDDVYENASTGSGNEEDTQNDDPASKLSRNACWADAMAKVLHSNKPKNSRTIILAKARKDADIIKSRAAREELASINQAAFEIASQDPNKPDVKSTIILKQEDQKPVISKAEFDRRQKKRDWDLIGRIKTDFANDRDKERALGKLATKGVVQLFNAVRIQQKNIHVEMQRAGPLERKRDKVLKSLDKKAFLNLLQGQTKGKTSVKHETEVKDEPMDAGDESECENPSWSVLRDDYMNGGKPARIRDWNKGSSDEEGD